jgi:hypothetical protein
MKTGIKTFFGAIVFLVLLVSTAVGQESPIKSVLVSSMTSYGPGEPIKMQVSVFNEGVEEVITRKDFLDQSFYLYITFTDPDGILIRQKYAGGGAEPKAPHRFEGRDIALVEVIAPGGENTTVMDNARAYYGLTKYGPYTAQVFFALETFADYEIKPYSEELFSWLDDSGRQFFNPVASNKVAFEILPPSDKPMASVNISVREVYKTEKSQKKKGKNKPAPNAKKLPSEGISVRLYPRAQAEAAGIKPINRKTYWQIWQQLTPLYISETASDGIATFSVPQDDYVVICGYNTAHEFRYMGSPIGDDDENWGTDEPIKKNFMITIETNGAKSYNAD